MYASVPSWWDWGIPPNAWTHTMHEVPLLLHLSLMTITPLSRFMLHVILIFSSYFIHIPIGVMIPDNLSCFMSYNSCCSHSHILYKHAIIIQGPHIVTCITYHIKLSSIYSIHTRSHDFVLKHIKLAYNLMTRVVRIRIFILFILDFMLRFYFCCQNEKILCCIYCRWEMYDFYQGNYYLNGKVIKTFYIPIYNSPPSLETTFALQTFRIFEGVWEYEKIERVSQEKRVRWFAGFSSVSGRREKRPRLSVLNIVARRSE